MRRWRGTGGLAIAVAALTVSAPSAAAAPGPRCDGEVWSRPGLSRVIDGVCLNTDRVRVAAQPEHGRVAGERFDGWTFRFRLETEPGAPIEDSFVLELDGVDGEVRHTVRIHNVPLSQNSPPECWPITVAERTSGLERGVASFIAECWDSDHDDFTVHGGGPGDHLDAPATVANARDQYSPPGWRYRTTINAGTEQTTMWAVDSQGARSATAPVSVMVGPLVDRAPLCHTNPYFGGQSGGDVFGRAGLTRRFAILCEDDDGDAIEPALVTPPLAGRVTRFDVGEPQGGWWGTERWIDATYVPDPVRIVDDGFTVLPAGPRGPGPLARFRMVDRPLTENGGAACGWSGGTTSPGAPVTVTAWCDDADGDPLSAEVVEGPRHGTADRPTVEEGRYGQQQIAVRYTPEAGFTGRDALTVRVTDAGGADSTLDFDLAVEDRFLPPPPMQWSPGADPNGWFWSPQAWARQRNPAPGRAAGQSPATTPAAQARSALRTRSVRLVRRLGGAQVFAPRHPLALSGRTRALAVVCPVRCRVDSTGVLARGATSRGPAGSAWPGKPRAVVLRLGSKERRRMLRLRPTRVQVAVGVRQTGKPRRSARIGLAVRRP